MGNGTMIHPSVNTTHYCCEQAALAQGAPPAARCAARA